MYYISTFYILYDDKTLKTTQRNKLWCKQKKNSISMYKRRWNANLNASRQHETTERTSRTAVHYWITEMEIMSANLVAMKYTEQT